MSEEWQDRQQDPDGPDTSPEAMVPLVFPGFDITEPVVQCPLCWCLLPREQKSLDDHCAWHAQIQRRSLLGGWL